MFGWKNLKIFYLKFLQRKNKISLFVLQIKRFFDILLLRPKKSFVSEFLYFSRFLLSETFLAIISLGLWVILWTNLKILYGWETPSELSRNSLRWALFASRRQSFLPGCPTPRWNLKALIARGYDPNEVLKGILVSTPYTANATDKARRTPHTLFQESFRP